MSQRIDKHTIWAMINDKGEVKSGKGCRTLAGTLGCAPRWAACVDAARAQGWQLAAEDVTALQLNKHRTICVLKNNSIVISTYQWMKRNWDDVDYTIGVTVR